MANGRLMHGLLHPEFGHMRIPHDRDRDPFDGVCPYHGDCWEGLASGPAMAERWQVDPAEIPDGHPAWELEAEYLALGILNIVLVVSPERFIVGGGVLEHPAMLGAARTRVVELLGGYLDTPLLRAEGIGSLLVPPVSTPP